MPKQNKKRVYWLEVDGERHLHEGFRTLFEEAGLYLQEVSPKESIEISVDEMTQEEIDQLPEI